MRYSMIQMVNRYAPKWLIFQIDLGLAAFSFLLAYLLRFNFEIPDRDYAQFIWLVPFYLIACGSSFYIFKTYHGIVRYTSVFDAKRVFLAVLTASLALGSINLLSMFGVVEVWIPLAVIIFDFACLLVLMSSFRISVKLLFGQLHAEHRDRKRVMVFGAGRSGLITKRTIDHDGENNFRVVAFLDEDSKKTGMYIEGVPIKKYTPDQMSRMLEQYRIHELIISVQKIDAHKKQNIIDECLKHNINVKVVPPAEAWLNGELSINQIKKVRIEDLLERPAIRLDNDQIRSELKDKVVLVTGAAGSIGSELVRQLIHFHPSLIVCFDQAETPLAELKLELEEHYSYLEFEFITGDVRDRQRINWVMEQYGPAKVYHAAAYKHVPMMEAHPGEAVATNIFGSKTVADAALAYGVEKFVMVSTDKAVNPTNVMGASKRIAEIYIQALDAFMSAKNGRTHTRFITTRFGNVLGSNGSVIPRFRKQIEAGGPLTVTHPEICRYFMTIPEACQLILEAGTMGHGGEIFIFDMGKAVKIVDLARKMIRLSGFKPDQEIQIKFTGIRPGEKINEELLSCQENTLPTHHEKIMIARVRRSDFHQVNAHLEELDHMLGQNIGPFALVRVMKHIVPEFISNNSVFSRLDDEMRRDKETVSSHPS